MSISPEFHFWQYVMFSIEGIYFSTIRLVIYQVYKPRVCSIQSYIKNIDYRKLILYTFKLY